jgi:hypothetical protein
MPLTRAKVPSALRDEIADDGLDAGRGEQKAIARSHPNHPNVKRVLKKRNRNSRGLASFLCGVSFFDARVHGLPSRPRVATAQIRLESR